MTRLFQFTIVFLGIWFVNTSTLFAQKINNKNMHNELNLNDLIEISYSYYPKGWESYDEGYEQTKEILRLNEKKEDLKNGGEKNSIYPFLKKKFGKKNIEDMTLPHLFPCYHYRLVIQKNGKYRTYVINVSTLAPVFFIYKAPLRSINEENIFGFNNLDDEAQQSIEDIKKEIMNEFPHLHYFKAEWLSEKVSDISLGDYGLGEVFLYYSILTDHIY